MARPRSNGEIDEAWDLAMQGLRRLGELGADAELLLAASIALRKCDLRRSLWRQPGLLPAGPVLREVRGVVDEFTRTVFRRREK